MMLLSVQYCMSGAAMNNVLSNGNHTSDNNSSKPSSSLSDATATATATATADADATVSIASPWVQRVYST